MPLTNDFNNEITSLYEKFKSGEHFAFSKFADGEFEQKEQRDVNKNMKKLEQTYGSLPG